MSVASEEIERFLCSHPSYVPTYNKMVDEYNETQARRQEMTGLQHSSKYIRKHAQLLYDIENVNQVMDYLLNHPDNVNRRMWKRKKLFVLLLFGSILSDVVVL